MPGMVFTESRPTRRELRQALKDYKEALLRAGARNYYRSDPSAGTQVSGHVIQQYRTKLSLQANLSWKRPVEAVDSDQKKEKDSSAANAESSSSNEQKKGEVVVAEGEGEAEKGEGRSAE
ncbi:hypothetical protein MMC28_008477 [Mycoblastus sanguinarius]|nr:hypothetical protein [Mycoblastus sanguinarius]